MRVGIQPPTLEFDLAPAAARGEEAPTMRVRWRDPAGFNNSRALGWFLLLVGVAGLYLWLTTLGHISTFTIALGDNTLFEVTVSRGKLESAFLRARSMDDLLSLETWVSDLFGWRGVARAFGAPYDECCSCGNTVWPNETTLQMGPPDWMVDELPQAIVPPFGALARFPIFLPSATMSLCPLLWWLWPRLHRNRRLFQGRCPDCNYRLAQMQTIQCPECGAAHEVPCPRTWTARSVHGPSELDTRSVIWFEPIRVIEPSESGVDEASRPAIVVGVVRPQLRADDGNECAAGFAPAGVWPAAKDPIRALAAISDRQFNGPSA